LSFRRNKNENGEFWKESSTYKQGKEKKKEFLKENFDLMIEAIQNKIEILEKGSSLDYSHMN
jgi:hypothetical protein